MRIECSKELLVMGLQLNSNCFDEPRPFWLQHPVEAMAGGTIIAVNAGGTNPQSRCMWPHTVGKVIVGNHAPQLLVLGMYLPDAAIED